MRVLVFLYFLVIYTYILQRFSYSPISVPRLDLFRAKGRRILIETLLIVFYHHIVTDFVCYRLTIIAGFLKRTVSGTRCSRKEYFYCFSEEAQCRA